MKALWYCWSLPNTRCGCENFLGMRAEHFYLIFAALVQRPLERTPPIPSKFKPLGLRRAWSYLPHTRGGYFGEPRKFCAYAFSRHCWKTYGRHKPVINWSYFIAAISWKNWPSSSWSLLILNRSVYGIGKYFLCHLYVKVTCTTLFIIVFSI